MSTNNEKNEFSAYSEEELQKAQAKLNTLCEEIGVDSFTIGKDKRGWKKLVCAMIFEEEKHRPPGRHSLLTKDEKNHLLRLLSVHDVFSKIDDRGNEIDEKKPKVSMRLEQALQSLIDLRKRNTEEGLDKPDLLEVMSREELEEKLKTFWYNDRKKEFRKMYEEERKHLENFGPSTEFDGIDEFDELD